VSENRIPRRICGPKREEVEGEWRRLHNKELHDFYVSSNITVIKSRKIRRAGYVRYMGEMRSAYKILVGKRDGKIPRERPRRKWEDNIRLDLRGIVWIYLAQGNTNTKNKMTKQ
jgi:hypothetical protein